MDLCLQQYLPYRFVVYQNRLKEQLPIRLNLDSAETMTGRYEG